MIYINHRNHKPLLLLALPYHDSKTPFRDIFQLFPPIIMVVVVVEEVKVWQVNMEIQMELIPTPHFSTAQKIKQRRKSKKQQKNLKSRSLFSFFSCSCAKIVDIYWLWENKREGPRIGGGDGELEKGKRRVCEGSWYVAHDIWESNKNNIRTRKKDRSRGYFAVKNGLYI